MPTPTADFFLLLQTLSEHKVDFIVVGGVCAVLHGAPLNTFDLDVVHSRAPENVDRLLGALQTLDAFYREQPERRLRPDRSHLLSAGHQLLLTSAGPLDLLGTISTGLGYPELISKTVELKIDENLSVRVLELAALITFKEELVRDKDRAALPILRRLLETKSQSGK